MSSKKKTHTNKNNNNLLSQLQLLRNFVGTTSYQEPLLLASLKQASYNVQVAAELLLTGQVKTSQTSCGSTKTTTSSHGPQRNQKKKKATPLVSSHKKSQTQKTPPPFAASAIATTTQSSQAAPPPPPRVSTTPQPPPPPRLSTTGEGTATTTTTNNDDYYLLCQRWISDAVCTTRHGRVTWKQALEVEASKRGLPLVTLSSAGTFRGRLPDSLATMLVPLMRQQPSVINVSCVALLSDHRLPLGSNVPVALTISIVPSRFFDVFHNEDDNKNGYFAQKNVKHTTYSLREAAFRLLQFAEHGDHPEFTVPLPSDTKDDNEEEVEMLEEEEFVLDDDAPQAPAVEFNNKQCDLPSADAPSDSLTVELRPYQKQGLWFLLEREKTTTVNGEEEEEENNNNDDNSLLTPRHAEHGPFVECECGPVRVSAPMAATTALDGTLDTAKQHSQWQVRYVANRQRTMAYRFYVNTALRTARSSPPPPPRSCSGGILADAMGLGKTIEMLALICSSHRGGPTLVVAKLSLLSQWQEEIETKTNLSYAVYYGGGGNNKNQDLTSVNVVLTTYGTVQGEAKAKDPKLVSIPWLRVVLDEAHCIRNQRTLASKVCCELQAKHRWCVSGTVIQNSLDDIYGLLKFLKHEPWCWNAFWKNTITVCDNDADEAVREKTMNTALEKVRKLLDPIMLRRTKDSLDKDGKPILTLPEVETKVVTVRLSETEREFYNAVLAKSQSVFAGFEASGTASKSYFQIFSLLQRLRQVCDHIALTVKSKIDDEDWLANPTSDVFSKKSARKTSQPKEALGKEFLDELLRKFCSKQASPTKKRSSNSPAQSPAKKAFVSSVALTLSQAVEEEATHLEEECAICLENPKVEEAVLTPCAHIFCRDCLVGALCRDTKLKPFQGIPNGPCPTCTKHVKAKRIIVLSKSSNGSNSMETAFMADRKPSSRKLSSQQQQQDDEIDSDGSSPLTMARQILENAISGSASSKMKAVLEEMQSIWKLDPGSKILIFSHYLGFLDLLGKQFRTHKIVFFRLDGSLRLKERMDVLNEFRSCKQQSVLLMSMTAGCEGLNITAASSCFVLEPWWNSAKEDQCVNRVHRIGQTKQVRVRKFVVENSVEERILDLQKRKAFVASEIYQETSAASRADGASKLSLDDFRLIFRS